MSLILLERLRLHGLSVGCIDGTCGILSERKREVWEYGQEADTTFAGDFPDVVATTLGLFVVEKGGTWGGKDVV